MVSAGTAGTGSNTTGNGGTTGTAGSSTTGSAGSSSSAGTTGTAGDTSGAGTAGAAGSAAGAGGAAGSTTTGGGGSTGGAAGDTSAAGTNGGAGTTGTAGAAGTAADTTTHIMDAFPIAVTKYWFPSGWDGDMATKATFGMSNSAITVEDQTSPTPATSGPCSQRVTGAIGDCFKVTYKPVGADGGATFASVALLAQMGATMIFDPTLAPHVPAGATRVSAEVTGDVGGEMVQFNLWTTNMGDLFTPALGAHTWQKIMSTSAAGADQEVSPFGWYSTSTKQIVFYYDDIRIENTP
jgi:hypothetical protein